MKKIVCIGLIILVVSSLAFAAGQQDGAKAEERVTIKVMTNYNPNIETFRDGLDPNNNDIIQWLRDNSGFDIEVEILPKDGGGQKVAIVLASGDVPDIMRMYEKSQYSTLAMQGALYAIDDLLAAAPVYKAIVPDVTWKAVMVNDKIYALPAPQTYNGVHGLFTRMDYLEKLGLAKPKTVDEYYDVLKKIKGMGDNIVGLTSTGPMIKGFTGAFGIEPAWRDVGGKLVPGVIQPGAKDYLAYMWKLYDEGILDKEFAINKGQNLKEKLISGQAGMAPMAWWDAKVTHNSLAEKNPDGKVEYIEPPVGPDGLYGIEKRGPFTFLYAIPRDAKHPMEVIQLMDFMATEKAQDLIGFGFEGKHYIRKGDTLEPTPEAENIRWRIIYQWIDTPYSFNHRVRLKGYNPWFIPTESWTVLDNWGLFAPVIEAVDKNANPLSDFVNEIYLKFIMGESPVSDFDGFVKEYLERGGQESIDAINGWYKDFK